MLGFLISGISANARNIILEVAIILMTVISLALIVIVMMQEGETGGVSAISGGNSSDTFYGKNKSRSKEQILKRTTLILGAVMLVLSVLFFLIQTGKIFKV